MTAQDRAAPLPETGCIAVLSLTTPVAMGYIPLGMVFGFLFVQAGASAWLAVLCSLLVYAGAAQYMMIPMLAAGLPLATIALATLVVNLRHVFYGLSLLHALPPRGLLRWYTIFALTDETYSLLTSLPAGTDPRQMASLALLNQGWWVLGTAIGAAAGSQAQLALSGLDFVLAALFAVLTVEQWRRRTSAAPLWLALLAYAVAYALSARHALLIAISLSIVAGLCWPVKAAAKEAGHD
jgi:4-azaleucine resistance transporter AzlC